ncbi:MAG: hypothetical protein J2P36_06890 [Ktedonobacteraceae bacterium]|nr:hypothetical protein [Ktedonobacteraceae bacterium]
MLAVGTAAPPAEPHSSGKERANTERGDHAPPDGQVERAVAGHTASRGTDDEQEKDHRPSSARLFPSVPAVAGDVGHTSRDRNPGSRWTTCRTRDRSPAPSTCGAS